MRSFSLNRTKVRGKEGRGNAELIPLAKGDPLA